MGLGANFAPLPLCNPLIAAAGITAGAGLINSLFGSAGTSQSNKSYLQGIRETNQANKELYEQQVRDNRLNWNMENAYNSPVSQLARLRQAGINANDMVSNGNGQVIQTSTANPAVAPERMPSPFQNMNLGGIAKDAIESYSLSAQSQFTQAQSIQTGIENAFMAKEKILHMLSEAADIASKQTITDYDRARLVQLNQQINYEREAFPKRLAQADQELANMLKQHDVMNEQIRASQVSTELQASRTYFENKVSRAEAHRLESESGYIIAQWNKVNWENLTAQELYHLDKQIKEFQRDMANYDAEQKKYAAVLVYQEALQRGWNTSSAFNKYFRKVFGFSLPEIFHAGTSVSTTTINH